MEEFIKTFLESGEIERIMAEYEKFSKFFKKYCSYFPSESDIPDELEVEGVILEFNIPDLFPYLSNSNNKPVYRRKKSFLTEREPLVDVIEFEDHYEVVAQIPWVEREEDIRLRSTESSLEIEAQGSFIRK